MVVSLRDGNCSSFPFRMVEEVTSVENIPGPHLSKFQPISDNIEAFLKKGITSLRYFTAKI